MDISDSTDDLAAKVQQNAAAPPLPTSGSISKASTGSGASAGSNKPADKPLLRRKSDLPTDVFTQQALESHKRADDFLPTPPDANKAWSCDSICIRRQPETWTQIFYPEQLQ